MRKIDIAATDILLTLVLLTRLPLPTLAQARFARQSKAVWAFPLAGAIVSLPGVAIAATGLWLTLPPAVVAALTLSSMVILTGAMHEDGLADTADGLWGGFTVARRLEIMKDSHIGAYGVLALVLSIALRWSLLTALLTQGAIWAPVALAALSRAAMPVIMASLPNARQSGLSQTVGRPPWPAVILGLGLALALGLWNLGPVTWGMMLAIGAILAGIRAVALRKIGGQTGDILGATQQICEIGAALVLVALWSL